MFFSFFLQETLLVPTCIAQTCNELSGEGSQSLDTYIHPWDGVDNAQGTKDATTIREKLAGKEENNSHDY